jgi:hypothetical protein
VSSGVARLAAPMDGWDVAGITGGAYQTGGAAGALLILNAYAEGGQSQNYSSGTLTIQPVGGNLDSGGGWFLQTQSAFGGPGTNFPIGLAALKDIDAQYFDQVGATSNYSLIRHHRNVVTGADIWYEKRGPADWQVSNNGPAVGGPAGSLLRFQMETAGDTYLNAFTGRTVYLNHWPNSGSQVVIGDGTGGSSKTTVSGGVVDATGTVAAGSGATGSRPATSRVGAQWYDTTLHLPIWWNGSVWKDAAGNTV